jgi:hypothetical protein
VVAFAGGFLCDAPARALARSLSKLGVETVYLGREDEPARLAAAIVRERADSVELWLEGGAAGVRVVRELLRHLVVLGRGDVSIVVHRSA